MADAGGAKKAPRKGGTFLKPSYTINESKTRWEDGPMDPAGGAFWRNADASQFQTRFGANYKKTGRKESSLPAMYAIKSCDVFHSHTWVQSLAPMFDIPEPEHDSPLAAEGIPTNISTTILVPYIDTGMFGAITEGSVACTCAPCPPWGWVGAARFALRATQPRFHRAGTCGGGATRCC